MTSKRPAKPSPRAKAKRPAKPSPRAKAKRMSKPPPRPAKEPPQAPAVIARMVETPVPHLLVTGCARLTEDSIGPLFELFRVEVARHQPKRILVDLRESGVALTISDMNGLAKMVAGAFVGVIEKLAVVLRPQEILSDKFFEPSVSNRGLPTLATTDPDEALGWLATKLKPTR